MGACVHGEEKKRSSPTCIFKCAHTTRRDISYSAAATNSSNTCAAPPRSYCINNMGIRGIRIYITRLHLPRYPPPRRHIYNIIIYDIYRTVCVCVRVAHKLAVRIAFTQQKKSTYINARVCISFSRDPDEHSPTTTMMMTTMTKWRTRRSLIRLSPSSSSRG